MTSASREVLIGGGPALHKGPALPRWRVCMIFASRAEPESKPKFRLKEYGMRKPKMSTFERLNGGRITRKQRRELARRVAAVDPRMKQARPIPTIGRPVHRGLPSITARYCSSCPSDPTSRWTPCPPETASGGFRSTLAVSGFRLRARVGFSIPSPSPASAAAKPAFGYGAPHSSAGGT
jgi:hypothetical protein